MSSIYSEDNLVRRRVKYSLYAFSFPHNHLLATKKAYIFKKRKLKTRSVGDRVRS